MEKKQMSGNHEHESTTLVPGDDISDDVSSPALGDSSIDGLTRFGPGSIESLRFKWMVRQVPEGYVVDETIGASSSAFSTAPMSRENAIAFLDAREAEAHQRFESLRQTFLAAQNLSSPEPVMRSNDNASDPVSSSESSETVQTLPPQPKTTNKSSDVNVDDVMDRIARLLEER
jgi:hypothetical protein